MQGEEFLRQAIASATWKRPRGEGTLTLQGPCLAKVTLHYTCRLGDSDGALLDDSRGPCIDLMR